MWRGSAISNSTRDAPFHRRESRNADLQARREKSNKNRCANRIQIDRWTVLEKKETTKIYWTVLGAGKQAEKINTQK